MRITTIENISKLFRFLNDHDSIQLLSYLLLREKGLPIYYSTNRLMDLCGLEYLNINRKLKRVISSGFPIQTSRAELSAIPIDDINSSDEALKGMVSQLEDVDIDIGDSSNSSDFPPRQRTIYTLDPIPKITIEIPLLNRTNIKTNQSKLPILDLGVVSLNDPDLSNIISTINRRSVVKFLATIHTIQTGFKLVPGNIEFQQDLITMQKFDQISVHLRTKKSSHISLKDLIDLPMITIEYQPSGSKFKLNYRGFTFTPRPSEVIEPGTKKINEMIVATRKD